MLFFLKNFKLKRDFRSKKNRYIIDKLVILEKEYQKIQQFDQIQNELLKKPPKNEDLVYFAI